MNEDKKRMKLGIMQPYFFPYLGYFTLIYYCDHFVFFDTPQYIRRGWVNRNRIINPQKDYTYISVPIQKTSLDTAINQVLIDNSQEWKEKIRGQLDVYKNRAKYYDDVRQLISSIIDDSYDYLATLNIVGTQRICAYLGINTRFDIFSKMGLKIESVQAPDEWALRITQDMGYGTYVNLPGGLEFFDRAKYTTAGITIEFLQTNLRAYTQRIGRFESALSIIDVMMFNSPEEIRDMLKDYVIL